MGIFAVVPTGPVVSGTAMERESLATTVRSPPVVSGAGSPSLNWASLQDSGVLPVSTYVACSRSRGSDPESGSVPPADTRTVPALSVLADTVKSSESVFSVDTPVTSTTDGS